jgi:hypothetical protein
MARQANDAILAIEQAALEAIDAVWAEWESGTINAMQVRHRLENVIRGAYRSSVNVAVEQIREQVQDWIPDWKPDTRVFLTPYLRELVAGVQRNLREYKKDPNELSRRRAILRHKLGASVAAHRGYTDAVLTAFHDLTAAGLVVKKVWRANFINNTPCTFCAKLHNTMLDLHEAFDPGGGFEPYIDLQGPPAHPRCKCYVLILVSGLESDLKTEVPPGLFPEAQVDANISMSAEDVRKLPKKMFGAFMDFLKGVQSRLKGA